jgi:hypothetical protein
MCPFGMQNRTFVSYLETLHRSTIPAMHAWGSGHSTQLPSIQRKKFLLHSTRFLARRPRAFFTSFALGCTTISGLLSITVTCGRNGTVTAVRTDRRTEVRTNGQRYTKAHRQKDRWTEDKPQRHRPVDSLGLWLVTTLSDPLPLKGGNVQCQLGH